MIFEHVQCGIDHIYKPYIPTAAPLITLIVTEVELSIILAEGLFMKYAGVALGIGFIKEIKSQSVMLCTASPWLRNPLMNKQKCCM